MAWLNREKAPLTRGERTDTPDGLWERCTKCSEIILKTEFAANQNVCPKCNHHFPIAADARIRHFLDPNSFQEFDHDLCSDDPLQFTDTKAYAKRLADMYQRTGRFDAFTAGRGLLFQRPVHLGVFDFQFLGGSMGSVVGEKIARLFLRAAASREPAIIFSASGGARMQEGILSLMQMAKTCAALARLHDEAGMPYISVLTHPTTGGVAASFSMLGDVILAEPGALIGFAGPRVIETTIRQTLPPGFQRPDFLVEHGMVDLIAPRGEMKSKIATLLRHLGTRPEARPRRDAGPSRSNASGSNGAE